MADVETVDHTAEPHADLWTSDSERAAVVATETPANGTAIAADPETPADPAVDPSGEMVSTDTRERDASGQFTKKAKPRDNPRARVEQATAKEAAAKEEARKAREEVESLRAKITAYERTPVSPRSDASSPVGATEKFTFPAFDAYVGSHPDATYEDWQDAKLDARDAWREGQRAQRQQIEKYQQGMTEARAKYADWDAAVEASAQVQISAAMRDAVITSPVGPDLWYWLATHPDQSRQLAAESAQDASAGAVHWMRKYLEAQLTTGAVARPDSASVVRPSAARAPIHRVGGTATVTPVDADDLEFGPEYIRRENAREREQQKAGRW